MRSVWYGSGDVLLEIESARFKVHSERLSLLIRELPTDVGPDDVPLVRLPHGGIATSVDVEALLQLVYQRSQSLSDAQFVQTARVLRAATQFRFPDLRKAALARLNELYPPRPAPFACTQWRYVHEATELAIDCRAPEILPSLLYAIVTTSDFDVDEPERTDDLPPDATARENPEAPWEKLENDETRGSTLSASTTRICVQLMKKVMDHFTPILFTVPTGSHMKCTGIFADHWMEYAVHPAIQDGGVYKPLETLHKIQAVDWPALGLCKGCCADKKEEWEQEADNIWAKIENWTDLDAVLAK